MGPAYTTVVLLLMFAGGVPLCAAADAMVPGEFKSDPPTLKCLGFRWYIEGDDKERDAISGAGLAGPPKIAYIEDIRKNFRLQVAAPMGQNKITVKAVGNLNPGSSYTIGPAMGAGAEGFTIMSISGNELTLTADLGMNHAVSHTVYYGNAGLSAGGIQLVTDAGGELIVTIVHEMLHAAVFGDLSDVAESDNTMYFTTGGTGDGFLRFRDQTVVSTGSGVPTGAMENQWDKVSRP